MSLRAMLEPLRSKFAAAAQGVIDEWDQDPEGVAHRPHDVRPYRGPEK